MSGLSLQQYVKTVQIDVYVWNLINVFVLLDGLGKAAQMVKFSHYRQNNYYCNNNMYLQM